MSEESTFWFPAKRYGWGWGLPVRWQGWAAFAMYFVLLFAGIEYLQSQRAVPGLLVYLVLLTVALVAIVVLKGERPAQWRWRGK